MRVLLTGAGGFVGREVIPLLLRSGAEVHTLGRSSIGHPNVEHHSVDLLACVDARLIQEIGATHLLHLAWETGPGFWHAPENLDWVAASINLVCAFVRGGGKRAVIAGSCAEYDWTGEGRLEETVSPVLPATLYGAAKASVYAVLAKAAPGLGLSLAWARIFFPYGPGERPERLLGTLLEAARDGGVAKVSDGLQRRDFIHVEDVAAALLAILTAPVEGVLNVASGEAVPVRRFVEIATRAAGSADRVAYGAIPTRPDDPPLIEGAIGRLLTETGYRPRFTLTTGVADAVARFGLGGNINKVVKGPVRTD